MSIKHRIEVDGVVVNAYYNTLETAMQRVKIARAAGHTAEYAGTVEINPLAMVGIN